MAVGIWLHSKVAISFVLLWLFAALLWLSFFKFRARVRLTEELNKTVILLPRPQILCSGGPGGFAQPVSPASSGAWRSLVKTLGHPRSQKHNLTSYKYPCETQGSVGCLLDLKNLWNPQTQRDDHAPLHLRNWLRVLAKISGSSGVAGHGLSTPCINLRSVALKPVCLTHFGSYSHLNWGSCWKLYSVSWVLSHCLVLSFLWAEFQHYMGLPQGTHSCLVSCRVQGISSPGSSPLEDSLRCGV